MDRSSVSGPSGCCLIKDFEASTRPNPTDLALGQMWRNLLHKNQERKRRINIKQFGLVTAWVNVYVLFAEPKEHKHFHSGSQPPEGSVTG